MIRNKDMENLNGQMVENTKETGKTENNMEKVFTLTPKMKVRKENGMKEKELSGLLNLVHEKF